MQGFSKKSQEIIDYRVAHPYWPMETVAQKFGVKRQWVYILCKRAGVQSASESYIGMECHMKGIPRDLVEAVKKKANQEGLSMKLKTIEMWQEYVKRLDNN